VQMAYGHREATGSLDLCRNRLRQGDHHVGRATNDLAVGGGPEKYVGQYRHGAPLVGDGLSEGQRGQEPGLVDLELHSGSPWQGRGGASRETVKEKMYQLSSF